MLNYKLALQLEKAGFPLNDKRRLEYYIRMKSELASPNVVTFYDKDTNKERYVYIPLLDDLIDACGDKFSCLERCITKPWCAWMKSEYKGKGVSHFYGKTPEEVVAKLWLALNKDGK